MLKLLLAVDFDQEFGELAQRLNRHQLAVDVGARAAVRADHAAHDDLAVVLDRLRLEPAQGTLGEPREAGGDFGALGAVSARRRRRRGLPAIEQQRIDHDGFAGAGFAGQRGEARSELELRLIDDDEIAQLKMREHAGFSRRMPIAPARRGRRGPNAASSAAGGNSRSPADAAG